MSKKKEVIIEEIKDETIPMSKVAKPAKPTGGMGHSLRQEKEVKGSQLPPAPRSELQRMGHMKY